MCTASRSGCRGRRRSPARSPAGTRFPPSPHPAERQARHAAAVPQPTPSASPAPGNARPPACRPAAPAGSSDRAADTPRPPSRFQAAHPPSPASARHTAPPQPRPQPQAPADDAPAGSNGNQAPGSSAAAPRAQSRWLAVSAPPARQTARARTSRADIPPPCRSTPPTADDAPPRSEAQDHRYGSPGTQQSLPAGCGNAQSAAQSSNPQTGPSRTPSTLAALTESHASTATDRTSPSHAHHPLGSTAVPEASASPAACSAAQTSPGITAAATGRGQAEAPPQASQTEGPDANTP